MLLDLGAEHVEVLPPLSYGQPPDCSSPDPSGDVRCPSCSRLLAKRQPDGGVELLRGRTRALVHEGVLTCTRCGVEVTVRREAVPAVSAVFRALD